LLLAAAVVIVVAHDRPERPRDDALLEEPVADDADVGLLRDGAAMGLVGLADERVHVGPQQREHGRGGPSEGRRVPLPNRGGEDVVVDHPVLGPQQEHVRNRCVQHQLDGRSKGHGPLAGRAPHLGRVCGPVELAKELSCRWRRRRTCCGALC